MIFYQSDLSMWNMRLIFQIFLYKKVLEVNEVLCNAGPIAWNLQLDASQKKMFTYMYITWCLPIRFEHLDFSDFSLFSQAGK